MSIQHTIAKRANVAFDSSDRSLGSGSRPRLRYQITHCRTSSLFCNSRISAGDMDGNVPIESPTIAGACSRASMTLTCISAGSFVVLVNSSKQLSTSDETIAADVKRDNATAFALCFAERYLISKLNGASAAAHLCSTAGNFDDLIRYVNGLLSGTK